jgi:hypothetical protein
MRETTMPVPDLSGLPLQGVPAQVASDVRERTRDVAALRDAPEVRVVFGGHFSCGKSSLINTLMGRDLLPTDDFPETGVTCEIRSGDREAAVAVGPDGVTEVAVTTEAIAGIVSLVGDDGGYRPSVERVERVALTLTEGGPPPGVVWIDSPGINDTARMTERARLAATDADVLVWVVNSRQPLAEVEAAFLARHLAVHGPYSVLPVVNVFLAEDTPAAWDTFLATRLGWFAHRLADAVPDLPATGDVTAVSARAAALDAAGYGGPDVRDLVRALVSTRRGRVRATRLLRGRGQLQAALDRVVDSRREEDVELARQRTRRTEAETAATAARRRFERGLDREIGMAFSWASTRCSSVVEDVRSTVATGALLRGSDYGDALTEQVREVATTLRTRVLDRTAALAREAGLGPVSGPVRQRVQSLLSAPAFEVDVPASSSSSSSAPGVGAVLGGILGTILLPGVGSVVGAALGAGAGSLTNESRAGRDVARDRATASSNVADAGREASAWLDDVRPRVLSALIHPDAVGRGVLPPAGDDRTVRALGALQSWLDTALAATDAELARCRTQVSSPRTATA